MSDVRGHRGVVGLVPGLFGVPRSAFARSLLQGQRIVRIEGGLPVLDRRVVASTAGEAQLPHSVEAA